MLATIQKWGNSQGIKIPKRILEDLKFEENHFVEVVAFSGNILIQKSVEKHTDLDKLFEGYTGDYKCSEYDFGEDMGR